MSTKDCIEKVKEKPNFYIQRKHVNYYSHNMIEGMETAISITWA